MLPRKSALIAVISFPGMHIPQVDIHVENKRRDLLNQAGDGEIGAELLRIVHIATAAVLQVTGVRRSIDRRDIQHHVMSALRQCLAQLFSHVFQSPLLIRLRSVHRTLQAGIEQFEIE